MSKNFTPLLLMFITDILNPLFLLWFYYWAYFLLLLFQAPEKPDLGATISTFSQARCIDVRIQAPSNDPHNKKINRESDLGYVLFRRCLSPGQAFQTREIRQLQGKPTLMFFLCH